MAKTLMIQGTMSDAGKSLITAGLCRAFVNRGLTVAPFKPQNMALNSAVSIDGGEIGRAQALQANACRIPAHTDMNPVLIKPSSDTEAQLIVLGHAAGTIEAASYQQDKSKLLDIVVAAHQRLAQQYELIIVEGAGSPAEVNLRKNDIANMGFAEAINCPVILLGDIDRGGVFAQLLGTLDLLSASETNRIIGLLINKFRGDISLLNSALDWLATRSNKQVLGVVPYLTELFLDQEDALDITDITDKPELKVIVPALPRISNHTDFDTLRLHPKVAFSFIAPGADIPAADLIILPGSKNVRADLQWLKQQGWDQVINKHLRYGGKLLGICGGFQMLGKHIADPLGLESTAGTSQGLGLLPMHTELMNDKKLRNVEAQLMLADVTASGYEIHQGVSTGEALAKPFCQINGQPDGAISHDNQIAGTYLHGLFDAPAAQNALIRWAGLKSTAVIDKSELRDLGLERLAKTLESCLDIPILLKKVLDFDTEQ